MGVFARLLGRSSSKSSASTEEAATATRTAESTDAAETAEAKPEETTAEAKAEDAAEEAAEGVEIPKQQSAEKAADSEAGEGARK
ncbi:hypothetical protein ABZ419_22555 [Streptomyces cinnamoneus]|uniref:hypothetical protein n=1 Tax=Streptomyces cinnamoneus TaxID=53446 RepID=UPI0033CBB42D